MKHRNRTISAARFQLLLAIVGLTCSTLIAPRVGAQEDVEPPLNFRAVVRELRSSNLGVRSLAVARLNNVPVSETPQYARDALVALIEREVASPVHPTTENESEIYGEYIIELVESILRLNDPRGLHGVAILGIGTSLDAQRFIVRQGPAALPALEKAWKMSNVRPDVVATWGLLLASAPAWLSPDARYTILKRIAGAAPTMPISIANVARDDSILSLMPFLTPAAADRDDAIVTETIEKGLAVLRQRMHTLSPAALLSELSLGTRLFCEGARGNRLGACMAVQNSIVTATQHLAASEAPAAHDVLRALVARAEQAGRSGAFSPMELTFVREVAIAADSARSR